MSPTLIVPLAARAPFSLPQAIAFLRRFAPCGADLVLGDASIRGAVVSAGQAVAFEIRDRDGLEVALESRSRSEPALRWAANRARDLVGADDAVEPFYDLAAGDVAPFRNVVRELHGLHHVRFLTLAEVTVYALLMQRTPIVLAAKQKRAFMQTFGHGVGDLVAFPSMEDLLPLRAADYARVLAPKKAATLPGIVNGVFALGEDYLRTAPYPEAAAALRAIPGIGPFSAAFILLRGLGRMDEVPLEMPSFGNVARRIYGSGFDPSRVRARYGSLLGYWAYYVKTSGR